MLEAIYMVLHRTTCCAPNQIWDFATETSFSNRSTKKCHYIRFNVISTVIHKACSSAARTRRQCGGISKMTYTKPSVYGHNLGIMSLFMVQAM